MVVAVIPRALPSLEPQVRAIQVALENNLQAALDAVQEKYDDIANPIPLVMPLAYRTALISSYKQVIAWPTVTITSRGMHVINADEQGGHQWWRGTIDIDAFLQNSDIDALSIQLYRYVAALWLAVIQEDLIANSLIDYTTMTVDVADQPNATGTARATGLSLDLLIQT